VRDRTVSPSNQRSVGHRSVATELATPRPKNESIVNDKNFRYLRTTFRTSTGSVSSGRQPSGRSLAPGMDRRDTLTLNGVNMGTTLFSYPKPQSAFRAIWTRNASSVLVLLAATALAQAPVAASAAGTEMSQAKQVYGQERTRCMNAPKSEDQAACLKSAGAALQVAQQGQLDTAPHPYGENALARCNPLPASDRQDCIRRIQGAGTTSGSVAAGGISRELTTKVAAPAPAQ